MQDLLGRRNLSRSDVRVHFALAALTVGLGRDRARVTLGEIGELAGVYDSAHVAGSLAHLAAVGLYHCKGRKRGRRVTRWITWPPSSAASDGGDAGIETASQSDDLDGDILRQLGVLYRGLHAVDPHACLRAVRRMHSLTSDTLPAVLRSVRAGLEIWQAMEPRSRVALFMVLVHQVGLHDDTPEVPPARMTAVEVRLGQR